MQLENYLTIAGELIEIGGDAWSDEVLAGDPFQGDYFDGSVLEDKILKVRNTKSLCHTCLSILKPKTFTRSIVMSEYGSIIKARFCQDCCHDLGYGDQLFEGNLYIDQDDDEAWEKACKWDAKKKEWIEPRELYEEREEIRSKNEKHLVKVLGKRYFEASKEDMYNAMLSKDNA